VWTLLFVFFSPYSVQKKEESKWQKGLAGIIIMNSVDPTKAKIIQKYLTWRDNNPNKRFNRSLKEEWIKELDLNMTVIELQSLITWFNTNKLQFQKNGVLDAVINASNQGEPAQKSTSKEEIELRDKVKAYQQRLCVEFEKKYQSLVVELQKQKIDFDNVLILKSKEQEMLNNERIAHLEGQLHILDKRMREMEHELWEEKRTAPVQQQVITLINSEERKNYSIKQQRLEPGSPSKPHGKCLAEQKLDPKMEQMSPECSPSKKRGLAKENRTNGREENYPSKKQKLDTILERHSEISCDEEFSFNDDGFIRLF